MRRFIFLLVFLVSTWAHAIEASAPTSVAFGKEGHQSNGVSDAESVLGSVSNWFNGSSSELLKAEEAFQVSVRVKDANTLVATLIPAKDYYLYRSRLEFSIVDTSGINVSNVSLPQGDMKEDPAFGLEEVYYRPLEAIIALHRENTNIRSLKLRVAYQGCNEPLGVCYPPNVKTFTLLLDAPNLSQSAAKIFYKPASGLQKEPAMSGSFLSDSFGTDDIRHLFEQRNLWLVIAIFFGFGLLLAFTPCMLPMIPILSGIIVGQDRPISRKQAFMLSSVYVLAMAITYAFAGVAAGLVGTLLSSYLQNAWVLGGFALIFIALAFSMFGLYELRLPASIQTFLNKLVGKRKGGKVLGVFLMGMLSALIVSPCVAVPLAGALLYIGQTQDVLMGGLALFSLAIGMGIPLLIIGTAFGTFLPKAGKWMKSIQSFFGVLLLAVAIYIVSPVIPVLLQMLLWAFLLIIWASYLHAIDPLPHDALGLNRFWKGVGVIALITGAALLIGVLAGGRDPLQPLAAFGDDGGVQKAEMQFQSVKNLSELDTQLQAAQGRYVMLDFWAEWCVSCKEMDRFTFSDQLVQNKLKNVLLLRADVTANNADDQAMLKRFGLFGPPGIIFFDEQGKELRHRVIGFVNAEKLIKRLDVVLKSPKEE